MIRVGGSLSPILYWEQKGFGNRRLISRPFLLPPQSKAVALTTLKLSLFVNQAEMLLFMASIRFYTALSNSL